MKSKKGFSSVLVLLILLFIIVASLIIFRYSFSNNQNQNFAVQTDNVEKSNNPPNDKLTNNNDIPIKSKAPDYTEKWQPGEDIKIFKDEICGISIEIPRNTVDTVEKKAYVWEIDATSERTFISYEG